MAPLKDQTSPNQDTTMDLDDDVDFVEETHVRAQSRAPARRCGQKMTSSLTKHVQV